MAKRNGNRRGDASWTFDELPYSLNQMLRSHWATRRKIQEFYAMQFRALQRQAPEPCEITVTWRVTQLMDWDNCAARFKLIGDAMVDAGVLSDDNPQVIRAFHVKQIKVNHRYEQGFTIDAVAVLPQTFAVPMLAAPLTRSERVPEYEDAVPCGDCGTTMDAVRPGKYQCPNEPHRTQRTRDRAVR